MGRQSDKNPSAESDDLVLDAEDFYSLDDTDTELNALLADLQNDADLIGPARKKRTRRSGRRLRGDVPTEINDWRDPEDDIMFGFEE
ncbi:MAG: hypothetical protein KTR32_38240 [Granulosicoccus sp.]|nr:hypothetical protein [Granulosicoccus sp.]